MVAVEDAVAAFFLPADKVGLVTHEDALPTFSLLRASLDPRSDQPLEGYVDTGRREKKEQKGHTHTKSSSV